MILYRLSSFWQTNSEQTADADNDVRKYGKNTDENMTAIAAVIRQSHHNKTLIRFRRSIYENTFSGNQHT